ncbi:unnamed protein product [Notodromas monacha]|uniref:Platelet-derived growth factor (PDGF) family profile domain-containing protein n=1 Tax=Notodromas monacha TaxID=399045 RepID=A0A7R9GAQ7_9CRUS|nr:unnamed protein product [Notodromas monacha]CAG0914285.1 unnamed protein product [Notodromas monacha]
MTAHGRACLKWSGCACLVDHITRVRCRDAAVASKMLELSGRIVVLLCVAGLVAFAVAITVALVDPFEDDDEPKQSVLGQHRVDCSSSSRSDSGEIRTEAEGDEGDEEEYFRPEEYLDFMLPMDLNLCHDTELLEYAISLPDYSRAVRWAELGKKCAKFHRMFRGGFPGSSSKGPKKNRSDVSSGSVSMVRNPEKSSMPRCKKPLMTTVNVTQELMEQQSGENNKLGTKRPRLVVPSCLRLKRCGGCCPGQLRCTPTRVTHKREQVNVDGQKFDHDFEVHDGSCKCQCPGECRENQVRATDDSCNCVCRETNRKCEGHLKVWSAVDCDCVCKSKVRNSCSTGGHFNETTCECQI